MDPLFDLALRWTHFIAGIIWVGHNYSSVVQRPGWRPLAAADLTDDTSPRFQALLNREHGFFRWASVVAWSAGLLMLWQRGWLAGALTQVVPQASPRQPRARDHHGGRDEQQAAAPGLGHGFTVTRAVSL